MIDGWMDSGVETACHAGECVVNLKLNCIQNIWRAGQDL